MNIYTHALCVSVLCLCVCMYACMHLCMYVLKILTPTHEVKTLLEHDHMCVCVTVTVTVTVTDNLLRHSSYRKALPFPSVSRLLRRPVQSSPTLVLCVCVCVCVCVL